MEEKPSLGDQELEVLQFVAEGAPLSVREVAERYGESRGLARTTILTVMERLRKKGYLSRATNGGVYRYSPRHPQREVVRGLIREFVEKTLGGSVSPLVAYLAQEQHLTDAETAELQELVERLGKREEDEK